jgi:hypothetical protein
MKTCDDCGDELKRGTICKHCGKRACAWCYHHHHGVASVFYTPCDAQPRNALNGYFDREAAEHKMHPTLKRAGQKSDDESTPAVSGG